MTRSSTPIAKQRGRILTALAAAALASLCLATASAHAAAPPPLAKSPEDGKPGAGAGRIDTPEGIAADPNLPGHVYIADRGNARIDEFTPWGEFVKAWGWGVRNGEAKFENCSAETGCQKGLEGAGNGQFARPEAIAVDGAGDVYVIEAQNHRVQKFDPTAGAGEEAAFLLAFGEAGTGPGQLGGESFAYLSRIAADPTTDTVFVGEGERIQSFNPGGSFKEEIKGGCLAGKKVRTLAVGPEGDLYVAFEGEAEVRKLKASGPSAECLESSFTPEDAAERPKALALDASGDLYVVLGANSGEPKRVQEYDAAGKCLTCGTGGEEEEVEVEGVRKTEHKPGFDRSPDTQLEGVAASSACGADDAYLAHFKASPPEQSYLRSFGAPPDPGLCPQPVVPPQINAQYALSAETSSAELGADVNPKFWDDTTYHLEYGTAPCATGGCTSTTAPVTLTAQVTGIPLATEPVFLSGLTPGTTYHYRFVSQSSGGGPVYGVDPDGPEGPREATFEEGLEASFTTFRTPGVEPCPANEAFRSGPSALLPDCRAYELVSPLDKEGADVFAFGSAKTLLPAVVSQSSLDGGKLAYGSYRAFGGAASAPWTSQYVAARHAGEAWVSHAISPPREKGLIEATRQARAEFKAFSPDLCQGWVEGFAEPPLAPGAPAGIVDLYRRSDDECGGPAYEPLNTAEVPAGLDLELQGHSADEEETIFVASRALAVGGTAGKIQLYGAKSGEERFLCILPGDTPYPGSCTAGWSPKVDSFTGQEAQLANALSADGRRVYWTALSESSSNQGKIYLRENPFGEGSECGGEGSPCTLEVSKAAETEAGTTRSQFWAASRDGSKAIFQTGGKLYEYRRADESTHLIAGEVLGVAGVSEDGSRIYLASREAKGVANAEGKTAVGGQANLYFWEAGAGFRFIGALVSEDLGTLPLVLVSPIAASLQFHNSQVSPDGQALAFPSYTPLTGYDNTDRNSGEADSEVFLYDARGNGGAGKLVCASCNPSGARPAGREFLLEGQKAGPWTAARIPVSENVLYAARVLSEDGSRLFFESFDALSLRDTNGRKDVYQWEAAGSGGCNTASPTYSPPNGGCIDLISSGKSVRDSDFLDASPDGHDVFFTTLAGLLPQDYGLIDAYDARVEGGLPIPPPPPAGCEGEACQGPYTPPNDPTPASAQFSGEGNPKEPPTARCRKPKVKRKGRCVGKKSRHPHTTQRKQRRRSRA